METDTFNWPTNERVIKPWNNGRKEKEKKRKLTYFTMIINRDDWTDFSNFRSDGTNIQMCSAHNSMRLKVNHIKDQFSLYNAILLGKESTNTQVSYSNKHPLMRARTHGHIHARTHTYIHARTCTCMHYHISKILEQVVQTAHDRE
jgi:hypothetical protein